jgi:hypothetical protein
MTFVAIDENEWCHGIYQNGALKFQDFDNLDRTWKYLPFLRDKDIQYAHLYCQGTEISEVCPEKYAPSWNALQNRLLAFIRSFQTAKINLDEHCLYDLIPSQFLLEFCEVKSKIIDDVFEKYPKPENYDFLVDLEKVLHEIKTRKLNIDTTCLNSKRHEEKVRTFLKTIKNHKPYIDFNQFGTKTGRLTTKKGTFPILNLNSEYRSVIKPSNDFFLEIDFNAAELRGLLFLAGQEQPTGDIHEFNAKRLGISRDQAKSESFAWLYGSSKVDGAKFDSVFNTKQVLEKYYDGSKVTNYFGRTIESDDFHALNYIVQSSTSDMVLRRAIEIEKFLKDKISKIGFIVHDSLVIDVARDESSTCNQLVDIFGNSEFGLWPVRVRIGKDYGSLKEVKR